MDPDVLRHPVRFCGVRESLIAEARARQLQWRSKRRLKWFIADRLPRVPLEAMTAVVAEAWASWQRVCGLVFSPAASRAEADFILMTRPIDGVHGTLAEHELPPGDDRPLRGWVDVDEPWVTAPGRSPAGHTSLLGTLAHEFGHGIGLSHEESRRVVALMDPFANPDIWTPQPWDVAQAVARYGPPVEEPKTPEPQDPGAGAPTGSAEGGALPALINGAVNIDGVLYKLTLTKAL